MQTADMIKTRLKGYFADRLSNAAAAIDPYFDDAAAYELVGSSTDGPLVASGPGMTIRDITTLMTATWLFRRVDIHAMAVEGDVGAVHFSVIVEHAPTSEQINVQVADFWRFRNGLCVKLVELTDNLTLRRLMAA